MSTARMHAKELVQTFKGEVYDVTIFNVDEADMTRQQLEKLAAAFGRAADMACKNQARLLELIQPMDRADDPFKQYGIGDDVVYHAVTGMNIKGKVTQFVDGRPEIKFRDGSTAVCAGSRVSLASIDLRSKEKRDAFLNFLTRRTA